MLKARTQEVYRGLLRNHLLPAFGHLTIADIDEPTVRRWRKERLDTGSHAERPFGPVTVAKAYRLLHAILATAADDQIIRRNPCRIQDGGKEDSPERQVVPLPVVYSIADAIPSRYRMLVLLATYAGLRWGELIALRRDSLDLDACKIRITRTTAQLDGGRLQPDTPKSRAGRRTVAVPADLIPELRWHLERYAEPGPQGLVFVGPKGAPLRRNNFLRIWVKACAAADAPGVHFHDLRHCSAAPWPKGAELHPMQHSALRVNTRCVRRYGVPRAAGAPRGYGDLGLHGPPGSDATMMRPMPLRGVHHRCACWHRDASGVQSAASGVSSAAPVSAARPAPQLRGTRRASASSATSRA